jgi:hypothetical protein
MMLPSGGGHEFVCKRCKKPLEVDPSIIDNLKNIKDLDATIDTYFAPGSPPPTSPASPLAFADFVLS